MRILAVAAPLVGHLVPLLPLAAAARDAGHDVLLASGGDALGVDTLGLPLRDVGSAVRIPRIALRPALRHPRSTYRELDGRGGVPGRAPDAPGHPPARRGLPARLATRGDRPRVLVSRSTTGGPPGGDPMPAVLAAERVDAEFVLVRGPARKTLPPGVHVPGWLPIARAVPHVDAFVHHGGAGGLLEALAAGVPQLVVPGAATAAESDASPIATVLGALSGRSTPQPPDDHG